MKENGNRLLDKKKQKGILLTILALVSLVVITVGVTLAFFNYAKEGSTENSVTTGTITFLYTEVSGVGRGISIHDAYPISDTVGKVQVGEGNVFDFKVTSTTPKKTSIPYEVTARKKSDSTLVESAVKLYLTKVSGMNEEEVLLDNYSNLTQTTKVDSATYTEKTIYTGKVPANSTNYEQAFRLRMWIDENTNFSPNSDGTYPYNGKTFTVTVNVYANAKIVTDEEIALENNTNISNLSVEGNTLTKVEGQDYQYETTLLSGTTSTTINIETENPNATVTVEKIDSLAYSSNVKRLSTSKTLNLTSGDNYFKVTVTSENKKVTDEYKVKITVAKDTDNTLKSLSLTNCPLNETFDSATTNYTCTIENNATATTVSASATSSVATIDGVKEYSLVTGNNTITITVTSESGSSKTYTIVATKPVQAVSLKDEIMKNTLITASPTLTTSSNNTSDASGLYKSTATNDGSPTYYFRGNVTNNYVSFAGQTWRIIRINEDGTIRMIMSNGINNATYTFNSIHNSKIYMYYTNSNAKTQLESWYTTNIASNTNYASKVANGNYFCEQAKVAWGSTYASNSGASMILYSSYTPDFKCTTDSNGKGLVNASIGLITYDEVVYAGGYYNQANSSYYLHNKSNYWTMSPGGYSGSKALAWSVCSDHIGGYAVSNTATKLRAILILKADTAVTGDGTSTSPWTVV